MRFICIILIYYDLENMWQRVCTFYILCSVFSGTKISLHVLVMIYCSCWIFRKKGWRDGNNAIIRIWMFCKLKDIFLVIVNGIFARFDLLSSNKPIHLDFSTLLSHCTFFLLSFHLLNPVPVISYAWSDFTALVIRIRVCF